MLNASIVMTAFLFLGCINKPRTLLSLLIAQKGTNFESRERNYNVINRTVKEGMEQSKKTTLMDTSVNFFFLLHLVACFLTKTITFQNLDLL